MAREISSEELTARQKFRAQRIDHDYHAKPHPWRSRMRLLSIVLPILAVGGAAAYAMMPFGERMFLPGHVSTKHASFADRCGECHVQEGGKWGAVTDAKCSSCHDGALHSARQTYHGLNMQDYQIIETKVVDGKEVKEKKIVNIDNATCASCHVEHKANLQLTQIADRHCTQCHSNLKVSDGKPLVAESGIHSFSNGHPDWDALKVPDQAKVKFGHALHMTKKRANGAALQCSDCHAPDNHRAYMVPISYERNCQECHPLDVKVSDALGVQRIPHDSPEVIRTFMRGAFSDAILKAGGVAPGAEKPNPAYDKLNRPAKQSNDRKKDDDPTKIPKTLKEADPRPPAKWVADNIDESMKIFYAGVDLEGEKAAGAASSCYYCHMSVDKKIETIAPTKIPAIWLPRSIFDHEVHRVLTCTACHSGAATSAKTADVSLPNMKSCQECHHPTGARSGCNECHLYHDRRFQKAEGDMSMDDLMKGRPKKPAAAPAAPGAPEAKKEEPKKDDGHGAPAPEAKKEEPKKEEPKKEEAKAEPPKDPAK